MYRHVITCGQVNQEVNLELMMKAVRAKKEKASSANAQVRQSQAAEDHVSPKAKGRCKVGQSAKDDCAEEAV